MKLSLLALTFALFICAIIVLADTGNLGFLYAGYSYRHGDKVSHFVLYGLLTFLIVLAMFELMPGRGLALTTLMTTSVIATLISIEEISQVLFPTRSPDPYDLMAGYAGIAVFAALAYVAGTARRRRRPTASRPR